MRNQTAPLGNFVEVNPESITKAYPYDEILYIDISSVGSGHFVETPKLLALNDAPSRAKRVVRDGDTILATVRPNLRSFMFIKEPEDNTIASTGFAVIRAKENADPRFIYYVISERRFTGYLTNNTKGTSYPAVDTDTVLRGEIPDFDLTRQQLIASILSTYDDLIENNRRRIQLLEQSARLLYKEWFVHLRFPGHEHTTITDGVPEGWERKTIKQVCLTFDDGDWIESKDQGGEDFRLLQISNIGENSFVETGNFRYITNETFQRLRCNEVVPGDILISRMPKIIGRAWYVYKQPWKMVTAVDVVIAQPNPNQVDPFYFLYHLNSPLHLARCERRATGTTRLRVTRKNIAALPILKPPILLQTMFGNIASSINDQRTMLGRQVNQLARVRDLLLPHLINGEVTV